MPRPVANATGQLSLLYNPYQVAFLEALEARTPQGKSAFQRLTLFAGRRGGKALALDTPVPTPAGWTTIGKIRVGDTVFDEQGQPTRVTFVTDAMWGRPCFRVEFSDGTTVVADADHQWLTHDKSYRKALTPGRRITRPPTRRLCAQTTRRAAPRVSTTQALAASVLCRAESNHAIPLCGPLAYPERWLPVDPYVFGVWLGDGSSAAPILHAQDAEIYDECARRGVVFERRERVGRCATYHAQAVALERDGTTGRMVSNGSLHSVLRGMGVLDNKHVPACYLEASVDQRFALLQGLLDTDGTVDRRGRCQFDNTNLRLVEAVYTLATSLGIRATRSERRARIRGRDCGPCYRVQFRTTLPVFRLPRKAARLRSGPVYRYITAITPTLSVPVRCLQVDAPSSLFLVTHACIPTHNTKIGGLAATRLAKQPKSVGWVCAPTYPDLHDFVMPAFFDCLPEDWIKDWSGQFFTLRLVNDAVVAFRSLDDPERARGPGLDWAWIDETRKVSEIAWNTMLPALTDRGGQAFFTTSPNGFDWCYKRLYRPALEGEAGFWACRYKTAENPSIDPLEIARAKRELDPLFFAQEYEADFVTFAGAIYGAAVNPCLVNGIEATRRLLPEWPQINPERPCLVGMDPGADHPFAMVLLVATELGLVVCGEYSERNRPAHQTVRGLQQMLAQRSPGIPLTPHTIGIDKSQKQWQIELAQHGVYTLAAENAVVAGIQRVHSWLSSGRFFILEDVCPRTVEQLRNYKWAENQGTDGQARRETVIKIDDDLPDALRYALMLWPELPEHDTQADSRRRLEDVPEAMRWQVERMRRINGLDHGEEATVNAVSPWAAGDDEFAGRDHDSTNPFGDFWS